MPSQNTKPTDYPQAVLQQIALLAQNIVIARKRRKETQAQWAQRLGVSQPTMARIERGDPSVSMASYVMCMWLINQAQGLADLIAPQNDLASLEKEVARVRPQSAAPYPAKKESRTGIGKAVGKTRPAALPALAKAEHVVREREGSFRKPHAANTANMAAQGSKLVHEEKIAPARQRAGAGTGTGMRERLHNSTAAGLAALISGQKKVQP
ncbi:helix-turn-helix domain-containing protein [Acidovorax sp. LjRoot74]|uniref:helix-turn-helix transcriptional regulator n=1 Tax=Acidovorax sp. LjRoot74 TaxID=3342337 RepID=UPI003ECD046B